MIYPFDSCRSPQHYLPESPTTNNTYPNPIIFLAPQTGPTPPLSHKKRRLPGSRMKTPDLLTEDGSQIHCGWIGCGAQLAYDRLAITQHIKKTHEKRSRLICGWKNPSGDICGIKMGFGNLIRHTFDAHTNLLAVECMECGTEHREDMLGRHLKDYCNPPV